MLLFVLMIMGCSKEENIINEEISKDGGENMKKVLFIVAQKDFRDDELFKPKEILEKNGFVVDVASLERGKAYGADGGIVDVISIRDVNIDDYVFIGIVGGPGALSLDKEEVTNVVKEFYGKGKPIGAICIAPVILAKTGLLDGVKATVWQSPDGSTVKTLEDYGATYVSKDVVVDKNIITANGPHAAVSYGEKILELISKI